MIARTTLPISAGAPRPSLNGAVVGQVQLGVIRSVDAGFALPRLVSPITVVEVAARGLAGVTEMKQGLTEAGLFDRSQIDFLNISHMIGDEVRVAFIGGHLNCCVNNQLDSMITVCQYGRKVEVFLPLDLIYMSHDDFSPGKEAEALEAKLAYLLGDHLVETPAFRDRLVRLQNQDYAILVDNRLVEARAIDPENPINPLIIRIYTSQRLMLGSLKPIQYPIRLAKAAATEVGPVSLTASPIAGRDIGGTRMPRGALIRAQLGALLTFDGTHQVAIPNMIALMKTGEIDVENRGRILGVLADKLLDPATPYHLKAEILFGVRSLGNVLVTPEFLATLGNLMGSDAEVDKLTPLKINLAHTIYALCHPIDAIILLKQLGNHRQPGVLLECAALLQELGQLLISRGMPQADAKNIVSIAHSMPSSEIETILGVYFS